MSQQLTGDKVVLKGGSSVGCVCGGGGGGGGAPRVCNTYQSRGSGSMPPRINLDAL